jgi:hypothetical protein
MTDPEAEYERGFADGLRWVANILRQSALEVEGHTYGEFKSANGGTVRAIARTGQIHFANQLRNVAQTIEAALK